MLRTALLLTVLSCVVSCGGPAVSSAGEPDAGPAVTPPVDAGPAVEDAGAPLVDAGAERDAGSPTPDAGAPDAGPPVVVDAGPGLVDAGARDAGATPGVDAGSWRTSLAACWTDATCPRVMAVAHGGAWGGTVPYNSNEALRQAYALGIDGVKIDVRVTSDNVPVIAHSSPIEWFESLDCGGKKIESMTAAQVTACHRLPSTTETFQRLDTVLGYLRGKMVVQLCVKRSQDYARTIVELNAQHAEDFAFIETTTGDLQTVLPTVPNRDTAWYLVNVASNLAEVDTVINLHDPRVFMVEIDPGVALGNVVAAKLHPANKRAFIYDNAAAPTTAQLKAHFDDGFEVVSAQNAPNCVQARQQVNQARGVTPP